MREPSTRRERLLRSFGKRQLEFDLTRRLLRRFLTPWPKAMIGRRDGGVSEIVGRHGKFMRSLPALDSSFTSRIGPLRRGAVSSTGHSYDHSTGGISGTDEFKAVRSQSRSREAPVGHHHPRPIAGAWRKIQNLREDFRRNGPHVRAVWVR